MSGHEHNTYGIDCAGSIDFYDIPTLPSGFSPTESVEGPAAGSASTGYTMMVKNTEGLLSISCSLTNTNPLPASAGPTNTVVVTCTRPKGSGTVTNAVVSGSGT